MALFGSSKSDNPQELVKSGDFEAAFKAFRRLTKKSPEDFSLGLQFGEALEKKDRRDEAATEFIRIADLQEAKGHHSKALALYRRAEKLMPDRDDLRAKISASETSGGASSGSKTLSPSQKKGTDESFDIDMGGGDEPAAEAPELDAGEATIAGALSAASVRDALPSADMDDEISSEDLPAIPETIETLSSAEAIPEPEPVPEPPPPPPPKPAAKAAPARPAAKPAPPQSVRATQKTGAVASEPAAEAAAAVPALSTRDLLAASEAAEAAGGESADANALKGILRELTAPEAELVMAKLKSCDFEPGERIITEGEPGDSMYFIRTGLVRVSTQTPAGLVELGDLKPGDYFGEVTLLKKVNRTATIAAVDDSEVLELSRADLDALRPQIPDLLGRLEKGLNRRAMETIAKMQKHFAKH